MQNLKLIIILTALLVGLFFYPKTAFALNPPTQTSPSDGASISSVELSWHAPDYSLYSSNPYRVHVDDDSGFGSPDKDYYTSNTSYSPSLKEGTWFWRVRARDASGENSEWSNTWSFNLNSSSSQPSNSSSTSSPPASSNPSNPQGGSNQFTISNTPSSVDSSKSFSAIINLSLPSNPNTTFYLKGAFVKSGSSNYFGKTLVGDTWIKNSSSYSIQKQITTDGSGNFSGPLEIMPDDEDSGLSESGSYIFKVARYTSSGSGPTWSNEVNIHINLIPTSNPSNSPKSSPISKKSSPSPQPTFTSISAKPAQVSTNPNSKSSFRHDIKIASIAGEATKAADGGAIVKSTKDDKSHFSLNPFLIIGIVLLLGAGIFSSYKIILDKMNNT